MTDVRNMRYLREILSSVDFSWKGTEFYDLLSIKKPGAERKSVWCLAEENCSDFIASMGSDGMQYIILQPKAQNRFLDILEYLPNGEKLFLERVTCAEGEAFSVENYVKLARKAPECDVHQLVVETAHELKALQAAMQDGPYIHHLKIMADERIDRSFFRKDLLLWSLDISSQKVADAFFESDLSRHYFVERLYLSNVTLKVEWFDDKREYFWRDMREFRIDNCPNAIEMLRSLYGNNHEDRYQIAYYNISLTLPVEPSPKDMDLLTRCMGVKRENIHFPGS